MLAPVKSYTTAICRTSGRPPLEFQKPGFSKLQRTLKIQCRVNTEGIQTRKPLQLETQRPIFWKFSKIFIVKKCAETNFKLAKRRTMPKNIEGRFHD